MYRNAVPLSTVHTSITSILISATVQYHQHRYPLLFSLSLYQPSSGQRPPLENRFLWQNSSNSTPLVLSFHVLFIPLLSFVRSPVSCQRRMDTWDGFRLSRMYFQTVFVLADLSPIRIIVQAFKPLRKKEVKYPLCFLTFPC